MEIIEKGIVPGPFVGKCELCGTVVGFTLKEATVERVNYGVSLEAHIDCPACPMKIKAPITPPDPMKDERELRRAMREKYR